MKKPDFKDFFLYIGLIAIAAVALLFFLSRPKEVPVIQSSQEASASSSMKKNYTAAPALTINQNKTYAADVKTSKGSFTIEFFTKDTPQTVNNFVFLAKEGFYDGTVFHRIIKDFMIQGGDPKGDGTGGPGYSFPDEKITRNYTRGTVAMANSGPNTNGSQFFIMHKDTDLPKNYVIFGQVTKGLETIDAIASIPTGQNSFGEQSTPTEKVTIEKISVNEK